MDFIFLLLLTLFLVAAWMLVTACTRLERKK